MIGRPNHVFGRKIAKGPIHDSQSRLHVRLLFPVEMNCMAMYSHRPFNLHLKKQQYRIENRISYEIEQNLGQTL